MVKIFSELPLIPELPYLSIMSDGKFSIGQDQNDLKSSSSSEALQRAPGAGSLPLSATPDTPNTWISSPEVCSPSSISEQQSSNSVSSSSQSLPSSLTEDMKHEIMMNYLFQQQCSSLWVSDGSGQKEGIMLRKGRGLYLSCPPQLADSPFGLACAKMNLRVRRELPKHRD
jgi:hypothetical protein